MLEYAESVAERRGVELPEDAQASFQACRDFLNDFSDTTINSDFTELAGAAREAARQMAISHAKDTTLDYDELLDELADDVRAAMNEGGALREAVSDVTEQAVARHETGSQQVRESFEQFKAEQAAAPLPDMRPAPPIEAYKDLEYEYEPD
jgi:hypothetical protein